MHIHLITTVYLYLFHWMLIYLSNAEGVAGHTLSWTQRVASAIGVAKGIQFLHTGIVPGIFANNLKATSILLDENFVAKISSYDLPVLEEIMRAEVFMNGTFFFALD